VNVGELYLFYNFVNYLLLLRVLIKMVGRKCVVSPETAVEAIILFKDRVITSKDGEPREYS